MDHLKCLQKQVWSTNSYISLFRVVTAYYWITEECVLLRCDDVEFAFYAWKQAFLVHVIAYQAWCHSNIQTWLLIELERQAFFF